MTKAICHYPMQYKCLIGYILDDVSVQNQNNFYW